MIQQRLDPGEAGFAPVFLVPQKIVKLVGIVRRVVRRPALQRKRARVQGFIHGPDREVIAGLHLVLEVAGEHLAQHLPDQRQIFFHYGRSFENQEIPGRLLALGAAHAACEQDREQRGEPAGGSEKMSGFRYVHGFSADAGMNSGQPGCARLSYPASRSGPGQSCG